MKWKALIIPGLMILGTCVMVIGVKTFQKIKAKKESKEKMATWPSLNLVGQDSIPFVMPTNGKATVLIFFSPECEHCQSEALAIEKKIEELSVATVLWVSSNHLAEIKTFSEKYKLNGLANIHFAKIEPDKVFETFGSLTIPHIFVYNENQKLIGEFKGEVKVEAILRLLE